MFWGTNIATRGAKGREGTWKSSQTSWKTKPTAQFCLGYPLPFRSVVLNFLQELPWDLGKIQIS